LLGRVRGAPGIDAKTRCIDLATGLDATELAAGIIVTASALLDLVSDRWLTELIDRCRAAGATALFALSYDGRMTLTPADVDDEWVRKLVNRHQLGDKGFGPALGPSAAMRACERFTDAGYAVQTAPSDWNLEAGDGPLQKQLIEGWAHAAADVAPNEAARCGKWLERRLAHLATRASRIRVGHQDILATPR
jgi:hypothetical protein